MDVRVGLWRKLSAEKLLLGPKEIQPIHPKGDQSWVFIGRTDAEAETLILWPPDAKSWLIGRDPDAGRDWRQEAKGMTEDEMAVWHHRFDGHEFEWPLGVGDGQGGLMCCDSWGGKESDMTERLNWTDNSTPLQYSCLDNPMDRGAWWAADHGVAKSWTWLSDFTFTFSFIHWKRKWQPIPVFLPGESQGWRSLVGCCLLGQQSRTRLMWLSSSSSKEYRQKCLSFPPSWESGPVSLWGPLGFLSTCLRIDSLNNYLHNYS